MQELAWPVTVAFFLRLSIGLFIYPHFLAEARDHWEFGYEMGHIARSIVTGNGFADPYWSHSGFTAILTPVYPYLMAGIFAVFGVFSKSSALILLLLNCCFSSATAIPVFLIARRTFGKQTGRLASWVWAFFPYSIYFSVATLWYHAFIGFLLALIVLFAIRLQAEDKIAPWLGFGALLGLAMLTNPVIAAVAPVTGLWLMWRLARRRKRWVRAGAAGLITVMLVVTPWLMRNVILFHQPIPFKDGFWLEVCVGNVNNTLHWWDAGEHPSGGDEANAQFERMGEMNYMAAERRKALGYIEAHPRQYAWRSLRHVIYLWTGFWSLNQDYLRMEPFDPENIVLATTLSCLAFLGLWRLLRGARWATGMLLGLVLLFYPVPYYFSHVDPGFRHPLDPLLVVLACGILKQGSRRPPSSSIPEHSDGVELAFR